MKRKKQQRVFVCLLVFIMTLGAALSLNITNRASALSSFSDVATNNKYYTAIQFLKDNNILVGYTDGTFRPDSSLTRAELMKVMVLGSGLDIPVATVSPFSDVPLGEWYTDYIVYGAEQGYVQGYGDGTFKPNQDVNKVEALKILGNLVNWDTGSLDTSTIQNHYSDLDSNQWYAKYLAYAIDKNILDDSGANFNPGAAISRGQVSEYIYRDYLVRESDFTPFPDTQGTQTGSGSCGSASDAFATVENDVISTLSEKDELTVFQYDQALAPGDSFQYFTGDSDEATLENVEGNSQWFYWLDLAPGSHFSHPTKVVTVDSETCATASYDSDWWPVVNNQEVWSTDTERETTADLVYQGSGADFAHADPAAVVGAADVVIPDCNNDGSANKWAIVAYFGEDADFKRDAAKMTQFLCDQGYSIVGIDATEADPLQTILDDLNVIAAISKQPGKSLNHFTFYVSSHGIQNTGDIFVGLKDAVNAHGDPIKKKRIISLDSLSSTIGGAGFEGVTSEGFTLIHDTCYSGNMTTKYQAEAAVSSVRVMGWIGASSASNEQSFGNGQSGSYFTNALVACSANAAPWATYAACVSGEVTSSLHHNIQTSSITKLTPSTDDAMPLF